MELDGLLLADKGQGVTSFQVVARVRRALRVAKAGHGGTLDPMATGLLPLLLGQATRLAGYLQGLDKEYVAAVRLGVTTDTLDATGRVTAERPVPPLGPDEVRAALARFVGEIEQVPPMYSALHAGGRRLYELARAGVAVDRAPRRVRVDAIELLEWAPPRFRVRVACGSGTYVRSLAADVGEALGPGAHVEALTRTRVGAFALADAVPWPVVEAGDAAVLAARIEPADRAVAHLPAVRLSPPSARRFVHGQVVPGAEVGPGGAAGGPRPCRVYAGERFLGIGELSPLGLRPLRLMHADRPGPRPVSP
jgi:tRNA pseudouridine55 synthase